MVRKFFLRPWITFLAACAVVTTLGLVTTAESDVDGTTAVRQAAYEVLQPPDTWQIWDKPGHVGTPLFGDVDGDGRDDLIAPVAGGDVFVGLSLGFQFATPQQWLSGFCGPICQTSDVDGDGRDDLVSYSWGTGTTSGSANVRVGLSTGTGFADQGVWNDGFCVTEQVCRVGDVDGDGRADLVAFTPNTGLVWISRSTGRSFGENAVRHNYFCIVTERCHVGDVDGDGRDDLVAFKPSSPDGQKGNVLWSRSTGTGFEAARTGHGFFCIDNEICSVADFDGDGRSDIMVLKQVPWEGTWELLVALSDGQQFTNATPFSWSTSIPGHFGATGDGDGDGRADLLTYVRDNSADPVRFYLAASKPTPPTDPPPIDPPASGISRVEINNCTVERRDLYVWVFDAATGGLVINSGALGHQYDDTGRCPAGGQPWDFNPDTGRAFDIVVVDPALIGCGVNDPSVQACQKQRLRVVGNDRGPVWKVVVPTA